MKGIIIMGPQGSGKSTQARLLAKDLGLSFISTGEIFREMAAMDNALGRKIKSYLDKGEIVPDEITIEIIKERLKSKDVQKGFVAEGFPRKLSQAKSFKGRFSVVFYLKITDEICLKRLMARRVCQNCGANYNLLTNPPSKKDICDVCGGRLSAREDDTKELILKRLINYHKETEPILDYLRQMGILEEQDGEKSISEIQKEILLRLRARGLI